MSGFARAEDVLELLDSANSAMLTGDCDPWRNLWSRAEDVVVYGAQGGYVRGWAEVSARFERAATSYGGGGRSCRENVATWIGGDLACTVDLERHETHFDGRPELMTFIYRTTHLLRREGDQWRVVLRHADPLATFQGPALAHIEATPTSRG